MKFFAMILCILSFSLSALPVFAKAPHTFTSADGGKTLQATPIGVQGGKVHFRRLNGTTFSAKPSAFSAADAKQLEAWKAAMEKQQHVAVIRRMAQAKVPRVLFLGNSYSFHCPKVFEKIAQSEGEKITVEQVTKGGWTLAKHAASQETLDKIKNGKWDVVVLQEQSQVPSFPEGQRSAQMYPAAKTLADAIRKAGAIPVMFVTWGRRDGDKQNAAQFPNDTFTAMQKRLTEGYQNAAKHSGGIHLIPVGPAWAKVREASLPKKLYANDGSHPAKQGNYLAACVFYSSLYNAEVKQPDKKMPDASKIIKQAISVAKYKPLPYPLPAPPLPSR